jgi:prepilin-type N-terminal cleavage/methylation domain-containing protein
VSRLKTNRSVADIPNVAEPFGIRDLARRAPQRLRARRAALTAGSGDSGFTLIETVMALMVIGVVLLMLVYGQALALKSTSTTKQRGQMTALANQYVEQMRAMPYASLQSGMSSTDLSGDPNLVSVSSTWRFRPAYNTSIDEVVHHTAGQTAAPLAPHLQPQTTLGPATFSVGLYVTRTATYTAAVPSLWVTAVVTRVSGPGSAPKPIAVRTQVFSPSGCLATSNRPYSGPCQAFFYANSGTTQGSISVAGLGGAPLTTELGLVSGSVVLPGLTAGSATEQTTTLDASATTSGVLATTAAGPVTSGQVSADAMADDDPSTDVLPSPAAVAAASGSPAKSFLTGTFGTLTLSPATSVTAKAMGTSSAKTTIPCKDVADATSTTAMPCAASSLTALAESVSVTPGGLSLFKPITVDSSASPGNAWAGRLALTQNLHCSLLTTSGSVGCAAAEAKRTATVKLGAVPGSPATTASNWDTNIGLASTTTYSTAAYSEQGLGIATTPSRATGSSARAGLINYWNGSGYSSQPLSAAFSRSLGPATFTYGSGATGVQLVVTGTISAAAPSVTTTGPAGCITEACTTKTEVPGLQATLTYKFTSPTPAKNASFTVSVDLGSTLASASYKAAPTS